MNLISIVVSFGLAVGVASPAAAFTPTIPATAPSNAQIIKVAQGCGAGAWRGPWGHCRDTPYTGPLPNGDWAGNPTSAAGYFGNGCPPGMWHGPWGHCRDTPYHGRLPDGQWQ